MSLVSDQTQAESRPLPESRPSSSDSVTDSVSASHFENFTESDAAFEPDTPLRVFAPLHLETGSATSKADSLTAVDNRATAQNQIADGDPSICDTALETPKGSTRHIISMAVAKGRNGVVGASEPATVNLHGVANKKKTNTEDNKFVDPSDKKNIGNVVKFFYTSSTRKRPSSPVAGAPGCCNPQLHQDSDLYIKAKGDDGKIHVFEVVSTVLEKASVKFEAMVYGSHKRGNREEWIWELDDNPLALKILFCLLHDKFPRAFVASKPKPGQLLKVLQVFEKYEVNLEDTNYHLFASAWISGFRNGLATSKLSSLDALLVAYKLGDFKTTKPLFREAAHEISSEDGKRLQDFPIQNQEVLETVENIRKEALEALLNALTAPLRYLMDSSNFHEQHYCRSIDGHFECNQKLLGSLLANLVQQSLFPIPEAAQYKGSVNSLIEKLEKMEIRGLFYPGIEMTKQRHTQCRLGQAAAVEKVRGKDCKARVPLSGELVDYMYFACKRSGRLRKEYKEFEPYKDHIRDLEMLYRDEFERGIWGWNDAEVPEGESIGDYSDDSGIFDVVDNSVWTERKVTV